MILCDYCTEPIGPAIDGPDRRISAVINRPPEPPTQSIDLHASCVDAWVTAAKEIRKPPDPTTED